MEFLKYVKKKTPMLLAAASITGVIFTAIESGRASIKAKEIVTEECLEDKRDILEAVWRLYIPTAIIGSATIACMVTSKVMDHKTHVAMAAAYMTLHERFEEYKDAVKKEYGEEVDAKVYSKILDSSIGDIPDEEDNKYLFWDEYSREYFRATMADVLLAEYNLNKMFAENGSVYLGEFYNLLGRKDPGFGNTIGWCASHFYEENKTPWIDFKHERVHMDDNLECFIITMHPSCYPDFTWA